MTASVAAGPTGIERIVAPDELFFSTTDRRGVIRTGNSVFSRISGYSFSELIGSPHSIVRHPDMPAGAYRLMWDRLLAGRPCGAFVQNLGKDGSHYWVFATVTPLGDGFLSVRLSPRSALLEPAKQLYQQVRAAEHDAAVADGLDRRAVAGVGARLLEDGLRALGFETYDDFLLEALPAEMASRGRLAVGLSGRSWLSGPIAEVIAAVGVLHGLLDDQLDRLETYRLLSDRLATSANDVLRVARHLDRCVDAARVASAQVADTAPVLLNVAEVMAQPMHVTVTALERLAPRLHRLRARVSALRFRIALAGLHNDMVSALAAEVADGVAPPAALGQVPLLCDAVQEGITQTAQSARTVAAELDDVVPLITEAGERLEEFRRFLGQWRILVVRSPASAALGELLRPIDDDIAAGHHGIQVLRGLGDQCRSVTVPMDVASLAGQVTRIRRAAAGA